MDPLVTSLGVPSGLAGWQILQNKTPADFPALTKDPVVQREISYFQANAPKATTAQALMSDPRLSDFVLKAYGLGAESGMTALMVKVLNSDPTSSNSFAVQMVNPQFVQLAKDFNYGGAVTPAKPPTPSSAEVDINGLFQQSNFSNFSGTFGGVTVSNVNLTGATTWQGLATTLQTAFQRADGNRTDISVKLDGPNLIFSDAKGRGTAQAFSWTPNPANTQPNPTASSPINLVTGAAGTPQQGGASVTSSSFIAKVVSKYTEAQFEQVIGNTSNSLREALYAKQALPSMTSWNAVIASPPVANVIQTLLGLPPSFGALNVAQQNQVYSQRMNIKDFQDPTKVASMLTRFIAMSDPTAANPSALAAVQLLGGSTSSFTSTPTPTNSMTTTDSYSSAAIGALLLSSSVG